MRKPVTLAIVGAGMRGEAYSRYALQNPTLAKVVAVAEPRQLQREEMAQKHGIPKEQVFCSWESFATAPRLADAVIIATQDRMHLGPMLALAPKGYAVLMEKPMSTTLADCEAIVACAKKQGSIFAVCHVLLYTEFTMRLKALLNTGLIGEVIAIQHLEPVGWWHQAHSFVRGNWSKENESSFMLLQKCCHDIDWLRHIMGRPCWRVASFGSLRHFRASERPAGAARPLPRLPHRDLLPVLRQAVLPGPVRPRLDQPVLRGRDYRRPHAGRGKQSVAGRPLWALRVCVRQ